MSVIPLSFRYLESLSTVSMLSLIHISFRNNQAFHENVEEKKACEILLKYMENMRQMQMETQRAAYTILVSKKGKVTIKSKMKKGEKKMCIRDRYLTMYAEGLAGVVIMGTGHQGMLTLCAGRMICRIIAAFKGWKYRSTFVDNLSFGGFNKKFEPGETSKEWITSDKKKRDEYVRDPLCSYTFTLGAYYQMFAGMKVLVRKGSMKRIPKTLPVLFTAGSDDPVGAFGKNVIRVYEKYKDAGIKDVSIHLYKCCLLYTSRCV